MATPYRRTISRGVDASDCMNFEVESVVGAASVFVVAAGLWKHDFGAGTTLAMLGLVLVLRSLAITILARLRARREDAR